MKLDYVLCQGGLWENAPCFMLQGYKDKKDFKPEMSVEVRRAGRISVWYKLSPEEGFWIITSEIPGGGEIACLWRLLELNAAHRESGRVSRHQYQSPSTQRPEKGSRIWTWSSGPNMCQITISVSAFQLCALNLAEESLRLQMRRQAVGCNNTCVLKAKHWPSRDP